MKHRDSRPLDGNVAPLAVAVLILGLLSAVNAAAQTTASRPITVGAHLEGGGYFAMPYASALLTVGFPIAGTHLDIVPSVGATYLFFPMSGLTGNVYVPVGLELRFTQQQLGLVIRNLVSIDNTLGEGGVSAGIEGYLPFAKAGTSRFSTAVEAGTTVFWNTASRPLILVSLSASLRYEYQLKPAS